MTAKLLHHWVHEISSRSSAAAAHRALAALTVDTTKDIAVITRGIGVPLFDGETGGKTGAEIASVRIEPDVYDTVPSADGRVRLLAKAAAIAPAVRVYAPLASEGAHRGRLGIDLPRRLLHAVGLDTADPGDRFTGQYRHVFFDDEPIAVEGRRAGLAFAAREGAWVAFVRDAQGRDVEDGQVPEAPDAFAVECARVVRGIVTAERLRHEMSPERAVATMRARGRFAKARGVVGRARLRRAIGWVDAAFPGGGNCFRRVLAEIGLDGRAATETLVFGLDVGKTGHVACAGTEQRRFDVAFEIRDTG